MKVKLWHDQVELADKLKYQPAGRSRTDPFVLLSLPRLLPSGLSQPRFRQHAHRLQVDPMYYLIGFT